MTPKRNDPCPCGSGRKYKHCCLGKEGLSGPAGDSLPGSVPNHLSPESLSHARREPIWEVDIAPLSFFFENDPGARPGALTVMAGDVVVFLDLLSRPPGESRELAMELQRGMEGAFRVLGHYPKEVLVRHRSVGRELMPFLHRHGIGLQVNPFLEHMDDMTAHLVTEGNGPFARSIAASPLSWGGWGLPDATVAEVFKAASEFFRAEPWTRLLAKHLTEVRIPGGRTWFAAVSGGPMTPSGCLLFQEPGDAALSYTASSFEEILEETEGRHYSLLFRRPDHLPRPMRKEIARKGWTVAAPAAHPILTSVNTPGGGISLLDAEDLSVTLRAITHLVGQTTAIDTRAGAVSWSDPATGVHLLVREFDDFDEGLEGEAFVDDGFLDDEARAELQALLPELGTLPPEDVNARIGSIMDRFNQRPSGAMGGLSPVQVDLLLQQQDWGDSGGPLTLNRGLSLEDVASSRDLRNTRLAFDSCSYTPQGRMA